MDPRGLTSASQRKPTCDGIQTETAIDAFAAVERAQFVIKAYGDLMNPPEASPASQSAVVSQNETLYALQAMAIAKRLRPQRLAAENDVARFKARQEEPIIRYEATF